MSLPCTGIVVALRNGISLSRKGAMLFLENPSIPLLEVDVSAFGASVMGAGTAVGAFFFFGIGTTIAEADGAGGGGTKSGGSSLGCMIIAQVSKVAFVLGVIFLDSIVSREKSWSPSSRI